jgi:tetratricopeptide (TPR) repeat protein
MRQLFILLIIFFIIKIVSAQDSAVESIRIAIELNNQKDFETSILLCNKAIEQDPELCGAYFLRGFNNYLLNRYKEAVQDFTITINKDPNYFEAIYYRAKSRHATGDYIGAVKDFNAARELSPSQTTFFMIKGWLSSIFGGYSKNKTHD